MVSKLPAKLSQWLSPKKCWMLGGLGLVVAGVVGGGIWWGFQRPSMPQAQTFTEILATPPDEQVTKLEALVNSGDSLTQIQARYLLATLALENNDPQTALAWLSGLGQDSSPLSPPILVLQAQAYTANNQPDLAQQTWQALLSQYPTEPEAATALIALGQAEQALAQFPQVPAVVELAQSRLKTDPKNLDLLRLIARYGLFLPNYTAILDQLTKDFAANLTPDDWAAIGFGYWENLAYKKAGLAYLKAPQTAFNAYRAGRALQLGGERSQAMATYQRVLRNFPNTKEAALANLRLGRLSDNPTQAIAYFQAAITTATQSKNPTIAADARLDLAGQWEKLGNVQNAAQARETLLTTDATTPAAAQLRWQQAQRDAQANKLTEARTWAQSLLKNNPDSELAPTAAFWLGQWAPDPAQREEDWQILINTYPQSYYTWRALSLLGKPVGTFTTVRQQTPTLDPTRRQSLNLTTGSETLQALYEIGVTDLAWSRWQWEFQNRVEPTASEQLTDGLIRLGVGDYLDGIFMLENLQQRARTEPDTATFMAPILQYPGYWFALYPLPFWDKIQAWSAKHQMNPVLVISLIRQESRFEVGIRSVVGATGLMQVMPETGAWIAPQIGLESYQLDNVDDSLNLGIWYFAHTHELHDENTLLALAGYNAGPGNVADWLQRFGYSDPDKFIEQIPFPETYGYVKSIFGNYWNYLRLYGNVPGVN